MTTINDFHIGIEEREQTFDQLDLSNAVIGNGVVLIRTGGELELHEVTGAGIAKRIGAFDGPAEAMNALDALEL